MAALVLPMMGLYQAGRVDKGYHTALVLSVVARVSGLLCRSIGVPDLLGYILEFAVVYLVCTKTARRLEAEGDLSTAARGRFVWKLDAACLAVTLLSGLLVPIMGERLVGLLLVTLVAALANAVFYMTFLYRASRDSRSEWKARRESAALSIQAGISSPWMKPPSWAESTSPPMTVLL